MVDGHPAPSASRAVVHSPAPTSPQTGLFTDEARGLNFLTYSTNRKFSKSSDKVTIAPHRYETMNNSDSAAATNAATTTIKRPSEITREEIRQWAFQQDPTKRNPILPKEDRFIGTTCAYTGDDGSHCIAGQFFTDHGYVLPPEGTTASDAPGFLGTAAANTLNELQSHADSATQQNFDNAWGYAIEKTFGGYEYE